MGRRGNNEGSVTQLSDGRWQARITLETGERKALYGKTRAGAAAKLTAALYDRDRGLPIASEQQTLGQYLSIWLNAKRDRIKPRSWRRYEELTRLHITPTLGKIRLSRLTPEDLEQLYALKRDEGLSVTTIRYIHVTVRAALTDAERQGTLARNVARLVTPPRPHREEMHVLDGDEVGRLLSAAKGERLECLYVLAIHTGARLGELLALRWKDVRLDSASLSVQATLQRTADGYVFAPPKSTRSRRQIARTPTAVAALQQHRVRQAAEQLATGTLWQENGLVFSNELGGPLNGISVLRYRFLPVLQRANLPRMRFHDLRHTCATLLLGCGVNPKIVSELLGHSTVAITLDLYSHVLPMMQQAAASAMEAALGNTYRS
jgi:integrase